MATPSPATPAQALLALYGALDQAVSTGNTDIEATVARYLPGSTGATAGWYEQLLVFLGHRAGQFTHTASVPDLGDALSVLKQHAAASQPAPASRAVSKKTGKTPKKEPAATAGFSGTRPTPPEPDRPLSTVQKARMVYAIAMLSQLPGWYLQNVLGASWEQQLDDALDLVRGTNSGLFDHLRLNLNSRDGYPKVIEIAGDRGLVDPKVALVPLCQPKLMIVRNHPSLVITTEFSSDDVSLDELKDVIDPANWAKCLSTFFCDMRPKPDRDDGWARVLEQVSTTCPILPTRMTTPLKYWKTEGLDDTTQLPTACLEYALDEQPVHDAEGDGLIVLDEGFIRMTSTGSGVRIRTRKVVGFRNSAITPWGVLACAMGYGDQGIDMILDGVENHASNSQGWTPWKMSTLPPVKAPNQPTTPPSQTPPAPAPDTSRRAVELAVEMVNECVDDMSEKTAAVAAKWASGTVPIAEMIELNAEFTARVITDPWRYLERLRNPARKGGT
ncbi:hypothetical protein [Mycobacterium sp.]|uniref:hypothetical protein n=1 Tax=Mycobacterium sp. TaxID=1785 RepID=UPI003D11095F